MRLRLLPVFWFATAWWSAYALMFAADVVAIGEKQGMAVSWQEAAAFAFGGWLTWIPFSLGLYLAVWRFPIQRGHILKSVAALTAAVLAVVLLKAVYVYLTDPLFIWYLELPGFPVVLLDSLKMNFALGWAVVGVAHGILFYQRARDRELKVAELEQSLAAARLAVIQAKLNPHFMFNALNSVSEMVHQDADAAESMLVALSRLLRDGLATSPKQERPLQEEIALVEDYLMIESYRLGDRLRVEWCIDDRCVAAMTPVLSLQPLVENAIVHSIARRREPGWLRISAGLEGEALLITVENSRASMEPAPARSGLGLESLKARMASLYGEKASVTVDASRADVFLVRLTLPFLPHGRAAA